MNIIKKVTSKLWANGAILYFSLITPKNKKLERSTSKYLWNRSYAISTGAWPIYFPKRRIITDTPIGHLFLLTRLFNYLSYRQINAKLEKNPSVYLSLNEARQFIRYTLPKINHPFVLVTGDSDSSPSKYTEFLKNKYLLHWFAQNNDIEDPRVSGIPIGLDYHTLITGKAFGEDEASAKEQENKLIKIRNLKSNKKLKVFANFHLSFTSGRRKELYNLLKNNPNMYFQKEKLSRTEMFELQKQFTFNFSPVGAGLDCHRTWESLILGQIPIVERTNNAIDKLYAEFPIVLIDHVSEITEKNLKRWYKKYSVKFNEELEKKLTNNNWIESIKEKQKEKINFKLD